MDVEPEITWEGFAPSAAVDALVRREIEGLEKHHGHLTACRVAVRAPQDHRQTGGRYEVRILVTAPGRPEIVVNRNPSGVQAHEHVEVAIRDAFAAADRQLRDAAARAQDRSRPPGSGPGR